MVWILYAYGLASAITFVAYGLDKRRAVRGDWRIPERSLHLMELLGGWPGGILGQLLFHHKRRKGSYMLVFAGIVAFHIAAWTFYFCRA